jgi:hypothetical protein
MVKNCLVDDPTVGATELQRKFAYEGIIPAIPDKEVWPKTNRGLFMHPVLLISTSGRRK